MINNSILLLLLIILLILIALYIYFIINDTKIKGGGGGINPMTKLNKQKDRHQFNYYRNYQYQQLHRLSHYGIPKSFFNENYLSQNFSTFQWCNNTILSKLKIISTTKDVEIYKKLNDNMINIFFKSNTTNQETDKLNILRNDILYEYMRNSLWGENGGKYLEASKIIKIYMTFRVIVPQLDPNILLDPPNILLINFKKHINKIESVVVGIKIGDEQVKKLSIESLISIIKNNDRVHVVKSNNYHSLKYWKKSPQLGQYDFIELTSEDLYRISNGDDRNIYKIHDDIFVALVDSGIPCLSNRSNILTLNPLTHMEITQCDSDITKIRDTSALLSTKYVYHNISILICLLVWAIDILNDTFRTENKEYEIVDVIMSLERAKVLNKGSPYQIILDINNIIVNILKKYIDDNVDNSRIKLIDNLINYHPNLIEETRYEEEAITVSNASLFSNQYELIKNVKKYIDSDKLTPLLIGVKSPTSSGKTMSVILLMDLIRNSGVHMKIIYICNSLIVRNSLKSLLDRVKSQDTDGLSEYLELPQTVTSIKNSDKKIIITDSENANIFLKQFAVENDDDDINNDFILCIDEPLVGADGGINNNKQITIFAELIQNIEYPHLKILMSATLPNLNMIPSLVLIYNQNIHMIVSEEMNSAATFYLYDTEFLPHEMSTSYDEFVEIVNTISTNPAILRAYQPKLVRDMYICIKNTVGLELVPDLNFYNIFADMGKVYILDIWNYTKKILNWIISSTDHELKNLIILNLREMFISRRNGTNNVIEFLNIFIKKHLPQYNRPTPALIVEESDNLYQYIAEVLKNYENILKINNQDKKKSINGGPINNIKLYTQKIMNEYETNQLYSGIGVYNSPTTKAITSSGTCSIAYSINSIINASSSALTILFSNPEISIGTNFEFDTLVIGDHFSEKSTAEGLIQLLGRMGRRGKSKNAKVYFLSEVPIYELLLPQSRGKLGGYFETLVVEWHIGKYNFLWNQYKQILSQKYNIYSPNFYKKIYEYKIIENHYGVNTDKILLLEYQEIADILKIEGYDSKNKTFYRHIIEYKKLSDIIKNGEGNKIRARSKKRTNVDIIDISNKDDTNAPKLTNSNPLTHKEKKLLVTKKTIENTLNIISDNEKIIKECLNIINTNIIIHRNQYFYDRIISLFNIGIIFLEIYIKNNLIKLAFSAFNDKGTFYRKVLRYCDFLILLYNYNGIQIKYSEIELLYDIEYYDKVNEYLKISENNFFKSPEGSVYIMDKNFNKIVIIYKELDDKLIDYYTNFTILLHKTLDSIDHKLDLKADKLVFHKIISNKEAIQKVDEYLSGNIKGDKKYPLFKPNPKNKELFAKIRTAYYKFEKRSTTTLDKNFNKAMKICLEFVTYLNPSFEKMDESFYIDIIKYYYHTYLMLTIREFPHDIKNVINIVNLQKKIYHENAIKDNITEYMEYIKLISIFYDDDDIDFYNRIYEFYTIIQKMYPTFANGKKYIDIFYTIFKKYYPNSIESDYPRIITKYQKIANFIKPKNDYTILDMIDNDFSGEYIANVFKYIKFSDKIDKFFDLKSSDYSKKIIECKKIADLLSRKYGTVYEEENIDNISIYIDNDIFYEKVVEFKILSDILSIKGIYVPLHIDDNFYELIDEYKKMADILSIQENHILYEERDLNFYYRVIEYKKLTDISSRKDHILSIIENEYDEYSDTIKKLANRCLLINADDISYMDRLLIKITEEYQKYNKFVETINSYTKFIDNIKILEGQCTEKNKEIELKKSEKSEKLEKLKLVKSEVLNELEKKEKSKNLQIEIKALEKIIKEKTQELDALIKNIESIKKQKIISKIQTVEGLRDARIKILNDILLSNNEDILILWENE